MNDKVSVLVKVNPSWIHWVDKDECVLCLGKLVYDAVLRQDYDVDSSKVTVLVGMKDET